MNYHPLFESGNDRQRRESPQLTIVSTSLNRINLLYRGQFICVFPSPTHVPFCGQVTNMSMGGIMDTIYL